MHINRRKFVANAASLLFSLQSFLASNCKPFSFSSTTQNKKKIVLLHLAGGNDWFNTIIPHRDKNYYRARPSLAIKEGEALPLNESLAFHPAMRNLEILYKENKVNILLNVGCSEQTLSHQRAIEIWQQAIVSHYSKIIASNSRQLVFPAINVEGNNASKISFLEAANNFYFDVDIHYRLGQQQTTRNKTLALNNSFNWVLDSIRKNCPATIYNISLGGFDTHSNQAEQHAVLLNILSEVIFSFQRDLEQNNLANDVLTIIYSEFGRSLEENEDKGTEHGLTNHILCIGNKTSGGIYGDSNSLITDTHCVQFDLQQVYESLFDDRFIDRCLFRRS